MHLEIRPKAGHESVYELEVSGSNGVLVNNVKVTRADLHPGDVVVIGGVEPKVPFGSTVSRHVSDLVYRVEAPDTSDNGDGQNPVPGGAGVKTLCGRAGISPPCSLILTPVTFLPHSRTTC